MLLAVTFVRLGFWQLDRLQQRRAYEDLVSQRLAAPPAPLEQVLASSGGDLRYRRVVAEGAFDPAHEVVLYGRTQGDRSGSHVLTPLILDDGSAVAVDRGWVPLDDADPPIADAAPPSGTVRVSGVLFPPEVGGDPEASPAPTAAPSGAFAHVDLSALSAQVPYRLAPAYLLLASQDPPQPDLPLVAPLPDPSASPPHLSYAIQWFTFATIAVAGFPILVHREYRRSRAIEAD